MQPTAVLRAAVFFAIREKPGGGASKRPPPPARRGYFRHSWTAFETLDPNGSNESFICIDDDAVFCSYLIKRNGSSFRNRLPNFRQP